MVCTLGDKCPVHGKPEPVEEYQCQDPMEYRIARRLTA